MQRSIYFEDSVDFKKPVCVCVGDKFVQFSPGSLHCRHETIQYLTFMKRRRVILMVSLS